MWSKIIQLWNKIKYYITMNIKRLFEKTSTGLKEFVAKVDFANVVGLSEELSKYIKKDSNNYVAEINPDINFDGDDPAIEFVYGDGSTKSVTLDLASEEFPGLMSAADKNKIDNYVGNRLNVPNITYVNPEFQEEYTSIGYEGIKYTNGVCTFNVSNGDIDIKNDNIKINETEISYTRGSNSTILNQTGLIVDDTSTESFDNSTHRITITSNTIKYKYFIDNSMTDGENKSGDYTYTLPKANGRLLIDSKNEANPTFTNSDKTRTLTIGYDGIDYSNTTDNNITLRTYINDNVAKFAYSTRSSRVSVISTVTYNGFEIEQNSPSHSSSTTYRAKNIARDNFTYTFPDKSGTIELVDEEKDKKLKQITYQGINSGYQYSTSFESIEEFVNYVNTNPTTEKYMGFITSECIANICLSKSKTVQLSMISDTSGFFSCIGTANFTSGEIEYKRLVSIDAETAILPNDISILDDIDSNKSYSLDIAKCVELGVLTENNSSNRIVKAKRFNLFNLK